MPESRMTCRRCPRYDREANRCLDGKANPRRKTDTVAVVEVLGLRALCHYNAHRDAIAARIHEPTTRLPLPPPRRRRFLRNRPEAMEIEIEESVEG